LFDIDKLGISITYSISEIRKINSRKASLSKTIKLPATDRNKQIFGFAADPNSTTSTDQTVRPEARIEIEGTTVITGILKMKKPVIDNPKELTYYEVNILGDNADWKEAIKDLSVRDLDFSRYDHDYTIPNQQESELIDGSGATILSDDLIVYPLINYGNFEGFGGTGPNEITISDRKPAFSVKRILEKIFEGINLRVESEFFETDFFKRLYIPFTSKEFNHPEGFNDDKLFRVSLTGDQTYNTFTPLAIVADPFAVLGNSAISLSFPPQSPSIPVDEWLMFRDGIAFNDETSSGLFDNNSDYTLAASIPNKTGDPQLYSPDSFGSRYTAPFIADQTLTAEIRGDAYLLYQPPSLIDYAGAFPNVDVNGVERVRINFSIFRQSPVTSRNNKLVSKNVTLTPLSQAESILVVVAGQAPTLTQINVTLETPFEEIRVGESAYVIAEAYAFNDQLTEDKNGLYRIFTQELNFNLRIDSSSVFYNKVGRAIKPLDEISISDVLPKINQLDLIKSLKHLFNLYFYEKPETRKLFIEPCDDFYKGNALDWRDKVDVSRKIEIEYIGTQMNKTIRYRYKDDNNDNFVEEHEDFTEEILAAQDIDLANKFAKDDIGENENNLFAPTIMDTAIPNLSWNTSKMPKMWQEVEEDEILPEFSTDFEHRLLYYNGRTSLTAADRGWFNVDFQGDGFGLPDSQRRSIYPYMYSVDVVNDNDNSLYFNTTRRSHGLWEKFYRNEHKVIDDGRLITIRAYLTDTDISNLDFRTPILISIDAEPILCRLQAVKNYNPLSDGITEVELIKIVAGEALSSIITEAQNDDILPAETAPPRPVECGLLTNSPTIGIEPVYWNNGGIIEQVQVKVP